MATHLPSLPQDGVITSGTAAKVASGLLFGIFATFLKVVAAYCVFCVVVALVRFPFHTDSVVARSVPPQANDYYARIYAVPAKPVPAAEPSPDKYVAIAKESISSLALVPIVKEFVRKYGLENARVLDVGAGTGYLQDVVGDYVGLDISPEAARFYHKPFIQASATEMPVPDNSFGAIWSIFVLEHVPNPEQALLEMRRAVKPGGIIYLAPAWDCQSWYANGYSVRPLSDLDWTGKLYKAAIPVLEFAPLKMLSVILTRVGLRTGRLAGGPSVLHYRPLKANYEQYWMPDSDAINSLDRDEMRTWFTSRGDECLNCEGALWSMDALVIKVRK